MRTLVFGLSCILSSTALSQVGQFSNRWNSDRPTQFSHVLEAEPGNVTLTLKAKTTASGGETVAVYFADAQGNRRTGWRLFVIATGNGNSASKSVVIPQPKANHKTSKVPLVVVVENAGGRTNAGDYTLTVSR
jgi:hypothetical protein